MIVQGINSSDSQEDDYYLKFVGTNDQMAQAGGKRL